MAKARPPSSAQLGVAQPELRLDRLGEDAEDLPVEEIEGVDQQQHRQHQAGARDRLVVVPRHAAPPIVVLAQEGHQRARRVNRDGRAAP